MPFTDDPEWKKMSKETHENFQSLRRGMLFFAIIFWIARMIVILTIFSIFTFIAFHFISKYW